MSVGLSHQNQTILHLALKITGTAKVFLCKLVVASLVVARHFFAFKHCLEQTFEEVYH